MKQVKVSGCINCPFVNFELPDIKCGLSKKYLHHDDCKGNMDEWILSSCPLIKEDYIISLNLDKKDHIISFNPDNERYDIIGDVHSCYDELQELLDKLDVYNEAYDRTIVFLGDLVDRGPKPSETLNLVMDLVESGKALCIMGNHDDKLFRYLKGNKVKLNNGLDKTVENLDGVDRDRLYKFLEARPMYLNLDFNRLVTVHASWDGRINIMSKGKKRSICLYGPVNSNKLTKDGYPDRIDWALQRRVKEKSPLVVYGHEVCEKPREINKTINIDTGCAFGGKLTALRYPEIKYIQSKPSKIYDNSKHEISGE